MKDKKDAIIVLDTGDAVLSSEITSIVAYDIVYKGKSHELPALTRTYFGSRILTSNSNTTGNRSVFKLYPDFESACKARDKMISEWKSKLEPRGE